MPTLPGLLVRVTAKGHMTYMLRARWRSKGSSTRRELGEVGAISLADARNKALRWHELLRQGIDPTEHERQQRRAARSAQDNTFEAVVEEYLKRHVHDQRRAAEVERTVRRELLPQWGDRPVTAIARRDVIELVERIVDRKAKYQAHATFTVIRSFFNWAINRGIYGLETSPCDRVKPAQLIGARKPRLRVLDDHELRALWRAAEAMGYPYGDAVKLLALTGARKSEVAAATWREFDLVARLWTIPQERFKSDSPHRVPLSEAAVAVLESLPRFKSGDHLFSTTFGKKPIGGFANYKVRLDDLMRDELGKFPGFVLHDIRRTVRTRLSELRIPEHVAERIIGHAAKGLARVYDQHRYLDEMREALDAWAARLQAIIDPPPANVVPLRKG